MRLSRMDAPLRFLRQAGFGEVKHVHFQLAPNELAAQAVSSDQGDYAENGALVVRTGAFTGRSPKDRFIVRDTLTTGSIDWNDINLPMEEKYFERLYHKITTWFTGRHLWMRDGSACANPHYQLRIRTVTETPWANLFCHNMFLRPLPGMEDDEAPEWLIIQAPGFLADPVVDGTRQGNFSVIHFSKKIILIGGTAYTGEIKKAIFSVLNYLLPTHGNVLPMHCSANTGEAGDTALFFGLSGTGKTTLSTDTDRRLIGDDEHGWSEEGIFNFEGGCYAKCIGLNEEQEPGIFHCIRPGALVENVCFHEGTSFINYADKRITENTRVSYPIHFLVNSTAPSTGSIPNNIFFLTCDAYGILPPIARLSPEQALYQFLSGYTAKTAGTETGITEPEATFSACFGAPFLPLHPTRYAQMLGQKIKQYKVNCWLVNTGWTGGMYGTGKRIPLAYTRGMIRTVLSGDLSGGRFIPHPVFGMAMPATCRGIPPDLLNPRENWEDKEAYDLRARELAILFRDHFKPYAHHVEPVVLKAQPAV